mmetsp:Transcript_113497/g.242225  ORF Transcript_113497/g.242225 Transcript_113497/m.242225 type:complete len:433 (+) Transcript_113497:156-1454(+)
MGSNTTSTRTGFWAPILRMSDFTWLSTKSPGISVGNPSILIRNLATMAPGTSATGGGGGGSARGRWPRITNLSSIRRISGSSQKSIARQPSLLALSSFALLSRSASTTSRCLDMTATISGVLPSSSAASISALSCMSRSKIKFLRYCTASANGVRLFLSVCCIIALASATAGVSANRLPAASSMSHRAVSPGGSQPLASLLSTTSSTSGSASFSFSFFLDPFFSLPFSSFSSSFSFPFPAFAFSFFASFPGFSFPASPLGSCLERPSPSASSPSLAFAFFPPFFGTASDAVAATGTSSMGSGSSTQGSIFSRGGGLDSKSTFTESKCPLATARARVLRLVCSSATAVSALKASSVRNAPQRQLDPAIITELNRSRSGSSMSAPAARSNWIMAALSPRAAMWSRLSPSYVLTEKSAPRKWRSDTVSMLIEDTA